MHNLHFFLTCGTFQYDISWLCFDVSWCFIEKKVPTYLSPFISRRQLRDPHFFQNCGSFQYNISWLCFDVSWCCIENYHNFERNEDHATVFLKWRDFRKYFKYFKIYPVNVVYGHPLVSNSNGKTKKDDKDVDYKSP